MIQYLVLFSFYLINTAIWCIVLWGIKHEIWIWLVYYNLTFLYFKLQDYQYVIIVLFFLLLNETFCRYQIFCRH